MQNILTFLGDNKYSMAPDHNSFWIKVENVAVWIQKSADGLFVEICPNGFEGSETLDTLYGRFHDHEALTLRSGPAKNFMDGCLFYKHETDFELNPSETRCAIEVDNLTVNLESDGNGVRVEILPVVHPDPEKLVDHTYVTFEQADMEEDPPSMSCG